LLKKSKNICQWGQKNKLDSRREKKIIFLTQLALIEPFLNDAL